MTRVVCGESLAQVPGPVYQALFWVGGPEVAVLCQDRISLTGVQIPAPWPPGCVILLSFFPLGGAGSSSVK